MANTSDCNDDASADIQRHVTSASMGGESITVDNNSRKAEDRAADNNCLDNIVKRRRIRPTFGSIWGANPS